MTNAERYAILNRARRVLEEIAEERAGQSYDAKTVAEARGAARVAEAAGVAGDLVFNVLNTAAHMADDVAAHGAIALYSSMRSQGLSPDSLDGEPDGQPSPLDAA